MCEMEVSKQPQADKQLIMADEELQRKSEEAQSVGESMSKLWPVFERKKKIKRRKKERLSFSEQFGKSGRLRRATWKLKHPA